MSMKAINLSDKLSTFSEYWSPKIISQFNECDIMVVKVKGEFNWHAHEDTDDFFLVLEGKVNIQTENGDVEVNKGELYVVPKGVRHCPVAKEEAHLLLIEPKGTPNTGDIKTAAQKIQI